MKHTTPIDQLQTGTFTEFTEFGAGKVDRNLRIITKETLFFTIVKTAIRYFGKQKQFWVSHA
ncbi:MAG: hypothetical protein MUE44_22520 [Oscillatoriaceae cyanobacterium Prado104]|nr:hypothetical protein [Oscillatoriaceae cyanobacterium Prado104]